jgi:prephenate dehydratase
MVQSGPENTIAFQGVPGAYSHLACRTAHAAMEALACQTFEAAFGAVSEGRAALAMIPIENSVAGRVADIHHLMPESGLFIVSEHFQPVNHYLLAPKGATLAGLKKVHSHQQALGQCRRLIHELGLTASVEVDTAGAARDVAARNDPTHAALASELAAELNGLEVLRHAGATVTRFLILSRKKGTPDPGVPCLTTFVFAVRNVAGALYKAMGAFATNGVNMVKLESYMLGGSFLATQFYADIEGHPDHDKNIRDAFEELDFFTSTMKILGVYPAHPFRAEHR